MQNGNPNRRRVATRASKSAASGPQNLGAALIFTNMTHYEQALETLGDFEKNAQRLAHDARMLIELLSYLGRLNAEAGKVMESDIKAHIANLQWDVDGSLDVRQNYTESIESIEEDVKIAIKAIKKKRHENTARAAKA